MFQVVRAGTFLMVLGRLLDASVYRREETQEGTLFFFVSALATVGAFIAAYQWALNIIELSYRTGVTCCLCTRACVSLYVCM